MSMQHQEAISRSINSELSLNSSSIAEALLRRMVGERDGLYFAQSEETAILRYYANSIAHLI